MPFAIASPKRVPKSEPVSPSLASRFVLWTRCVRLARLCVLMNPILPGARSNGTWPAFAS